MGYQIVKLQNTSDWDTTQKPTITITNKDDGWGIAYPNWLDGKNPTDSKEWKKGIFAITKEIS